MIIVQNDTNVFREVNTHSAFRLIVNVEAYNTHLLCKGKYHCMADFAYAELDTDLLVCPN